MIFLTLRAGASGAVFRGENEGDTLLWSVAQQRFYVGPPAGGGGVESWNGRTGAVEPEPDDYDSDQIDNVSGVAGDNVSEALDTLDAAIAAVTGAPAAGCVQVSNGDETAFFLTGAVDQTYVICTGTDFAYEGSELFELGPNCEVTYVGADPITILVTWCGCNQVAATGWAAFISKNNELVDAAGELFNADAYRAGVALIQNEGGGSGNRGQDNFTTARRLTLENGDTFRPVTGRDGGPGNNIRAATLTLSFFQVSP